MSKNISIAIWTTAVLAVTTAAVAQTTGSRERFTFTVPNITQTNLSADARLDVVINSWATDAERDRLVAALKDGPTALGSAIVNLQEAGYINFPNYLQYLVRYAARVPRPDGGEDIILGIDRPVSLWWMPGSPAVPSGTFTLIQLRLNKDGKGEGRIATDGKVTASAQAKTVVLDTFESHPAVLLNVERARGQSTN